MYTDTFTISRSFYSNSTIQLEKEKVVFLSYMESSSSIETRVDNKVNINFAYLNFITFAEP